MKISRIETYVAQQQLDKPFYFSQFEFQTRQICLVKVVAADGTYGWGEGYGPATVVKAGIEFLAPLVLGEDPLQVEAIWSKMHLRSLDYARRGVLVAAISAIDIALWDLRGKLLGQPVSVLLGGRRRESVRVYATGLYFTEADDPDSQVAALVEEAQLYAAQGFSAIKMKVGLGVETDLRHVRAVRQAIGDDIELMVDANHAYSLNEALSFARGIEPLGISFFRGTGVAGRLRRLSRPAAADFHRHRRRRMRISAGWFPSALEPALRRYCPARYLWRRRLDRGQTNHGIGERLPDQHYPA